MNSKKEKLSLYIFFISTILIGFQIIIGVNPILQVELDNGEIIKSTIPISFPLHTTFILMFLTAISSISLFYYLDILNKNKKISLKNSVKLNMLKEDEKKVFEYLLENNNVLQRDMMYELDFSKVKLSRILHNLEQKNILERISKGNSNKIRLK
jgi:uncharacterized membrane protein